MRRTSRSKPRSKLRIRNELVERRGQRVEVPWRNEPSARWSNDFRRSPSFVVPQGRPRAAFGEDHAERLRFKVRLRQQSAPASRLRTSRRSPSSFTRDSTPRLRTSATIDDRYARS
jgi:hypothetical protein